MTAIKLIVGLGNPGSEYQSTRHNAGFWLLDQLALQHQCVPRRETRFHGELGRIHCAGHDFRVLKPDTFMNRSGQSVAAATHFFQIDRQQILVVHDDLDLEPGDARLKRAGGHGGHNGLRDMVSHLGGNDFLRLRIGIGHPGDRNRVADYVLHRPTTDEQIAIDQSIDAALSILPMVLDGDLEKAMHRLHSK
ncbi:MAG: aminoacyl-tRNA hydrolase [Gammaproteobacteria bacterium]|nr:aminoacyl-tRNA hydrolase [Gammaproteobacteria bacterium]